MNPYDRWVLEQNAALQAELETEATYYEPPWAPNEQEAAAARELADQARARQAAEAEAEREIKDPEACTPAQIARFEAMAAEYEAEAEIG